MFTSGFEKRKRESEISRPTVACTGRVGCSHTREEVENPPLGESRIAPGMSVCVNHPSIRSSSAFFSLHLPTRRRSNASQRKRE